MSVLTGIDQIQAIGNLIGSGSSYFGQLQPASFNGVPFFTQSNSTIVGRRLAEHIYPFRDLPWMEDIGRKARVYRIEGFLIGDDVISQRDQMQAALEYPGPGNLIHPTYGSLTVSALPQCSFEENMTHGRVIKMNLMFEESGLKIYPGISITTQSAVSLSAVNAFSAIADDYTNGLVGNIEVGYGQVMDVVSTTENWITSVQSVIGSATSIYSLGVSVFGALGRFFGSSAGTSTGSINGPYLTPSALSVAINSTIQNGANDRALVTAATSELSATITDFVAETYAANVQNVVTNVLSALSNPSDIVNSFVQLNNISTVSITADLLRRSAAIGLCQAVALYQPTSQNDAENLETLVTGILDNEILIAGNEGDDETFYALTDLRNSVSLYLSALGSTLPALQNFTTNIPMPALTLAYQYYDDITRTDQLIASAKAVHPAFMPVSFQALSY